MSTHQAQPERPMPIPPGSPTPSQEEHLERGGIVFYPKCPFPLSEGDDRLFLLEQRLGRGHKNISYDPANGATNGFQKHSAAQATRLHDLFAAFARQATAWLANTFPCYARAWNLDRVSYRPEEEATRRLRWTARNDLLHVDAFPNRPTQGQRILRLFVNINPAEPRVWVTSDPFRVLLERYGQEAGLPRKQDFGLIHRLREGMLQLFRPGRPRRSVYDEFMVRFHNFLKANDDFQERCTKKVWTFPPNSCWLAFTDTASHAVLRGRYALEHSYFIAPEVLALPDESPPALLAQACGTWVLDSAA